MKTIRIDIEYDGTGFVGWAKQPGQPSIESALEAALGRILQHEVTLSVAGRTDAGVHARGQVASIRTAVSGIDPGRLRRSANQLLPPYIVITAISEQDPGFDARYSALSRSYSYSVLDRPYPSPFRSRFVHYFPGRLDRELLDQAAATILGRHDFRAFTPTVTEHTDFGREITQSLWGREGDLLVYRITSAGFLRNMVRVLVGTMLEIGRGYRPVTDLPGLLRGAERPEAGETASPQGLCLESVAYPLAQGDYLTGSG